MVRVELQGWASWIQNYEHRRGLDQFRHQHLPQYNPILLFLMFPQHQKHAQHPKSFKERAKHCNLTAAMIQLAHAVQNWSILQDRSGSGPTKNARPEAPKTRRDTFSIFSAQLWCRSTKNNFHHLELKWLYLKMHEEGSWKWDQRPGLFMAENECNKRGRL